jgi:hypothetical protein
VIARDSDEVQWLAPVTVGPGATAAPAVSRPAEAATCGAPLSASALSAIGKPDLAVTLDPATSLDEVDISGLRTGVTLTATGDGPHSRGRWSGLVPQTLDAFLADAAGNVLTETIPPGRQ